MTRLVSCELPVTAGPQLAALRAIRKTAVIWLPETVRLTSAIDVSACVASRPTIALCMAPAESDTTPAVALPGMSPTSSAASAPPPEMLSDPVAARIVVLPAGTTADAGKWRCGHVKAPAPTHRAKRERARQSDRCRADQ